MLLQEGEVFTPRRRGRCDILLAGSRVLAVEPRIEPGSLEVTKVALQGATVVPGFVDPHVHLTGGGGEDGFASRIPPVALHALVESGTTTVVGVLGTDGTTRTPMDLLATCRRLSASGLSAFMWTGAYEVPPPTLTGRVRTDIVVVPEVVGAGEIAISDHRSSGPTFDELVRLAADCRVGGMLAGKPARLHLHVGDAPRGLDPIFEAIERADQPASVYYPTHVNRRTALWEQARELIDRGASVDVTISEDDEDPEGVRAADAVEAWLQTDRFPAGLTVSTDAGGSLPRFDGQGRLTGWVGAQPGGQLQLLRELLQRGIELDRALVPMTSGPAELLGLPGKGTLEPGNAADLLILSEHLEPWGVIGNGRWLWAQGPLGEVVAS